MVIPTIPLFNPYSNKNLQFSTVDNQGFTEYCEKRL